MSLLASSWFQLDGCDNQADEPEEGGWMTINLPFYLRFIIWLLFKCFTGGFKVKESPRISEESSRLASNLSYNFNPSSRIFKNLLRSSKKDQDSLKNPNQHLKILEKSRRRLPICLTTSIHLQSISKNLQESSRIFKDRQRRTKNPNQHLKILGKSWRQALSLSYRSNPSWRGFKNLRRQTKNVEKSQPVSRVNLLICIRGKKGRQKRAVIFLNIDQIIFLPNEVWFQQLPRRDAPPYPDVFINAGGKKNTFQDANQSTKFS